MHVRDAGEADIEALARLRAQWRGQEATPDYLREFRTWFAQERSGRWWWLAEDEAAEAIGMVNLKVFVRMPSPGAPPSRWGYLANLFVAPTHRRRGVGDRLVAAVVDRARSEGLVRIVLAPSEQAAPLYARHAFRSADELLLLPLATINGPADPLGRQPR